MKLRTIKRRQARRQQAWLAHQLCWQVRAGRYRDISKPWRLQRYQEFWMVVPPS